VDCSSGDRGSSLHRLYTVAKIRCVNVGFDEQGVVDEFKTQMLPLTQSELTLERI